MQRDLSGLRERMRFGSMLFEGFGVGEQRGDVEEYRLCTMIPN